MDKKMTNKIVIILSRNIKMVYNDFKKLGQKILNLINISNV